MDNFVRGMCLSMCPEKERWMREREGLLHIFEIDEKTKGNKRPKADPAKAVKCYGRSAAGRDMTDPYQLRPPSVLQLTVKYLLSEVAMRTDVDWLVIYDFIFDRLRAIRQDLVIQTISPSASVQIYEPIIRFLIYSSQRLCGRPVSEFDPKINNQHLLECIKHVLSLYDQIKQERLSTHTALDRCMDNLTLKDHQPEMEALYLLLYLGDAEALQRGLSLPSSLRQSWLVRTALKISLTWYSGNYVRVFRLLQRLHPLFVCAILNNLQTLRRTTLKIMCSAYNSKVLTYPGVKLQELLLYKDVDKMKSDCTNYGITFIDDSKNIQFHKCNFKDAVKLASSEEYYNQETLSKLLPDILIKPM